MNSIEIEFWINNLSTVLIFLVTALIYFKINKTSGVLLFIAFAFMGAHSFIMIYASDGLMSFETIKDGNGIIDVRLISPLWFQIFILVKSIIFLDVPYALWLLYKQVSSLNQALHPSANNGAG